MTQPIQLSKTQLKKFLIYYQGLSSDFRYKGKEGIKAYIERVGCVQYDPLNVVGRNADLTLQSRIDGYSQNLLSELLYEDRVLVDAWDKMMSIYNLEDWPYMKRVRSSMTKSMNSTLKYRNALEALDYLDFVKEEIEAKGPSKSTQIELGQTVKNGWGHGKLSSVVMDYLFHTGDLSVYEKKGSNKTFELSEKLIPSDIYLLEDPFESDAVFYDWYVKRRIGSQGIYWDRNGGGWLGQFISKKAIRTNAFKSLLDSNQIKRIQVEGFKEKFYIRTEDVDLLMDYINVLEKENSNGDENRVHFIAPLDNLMWDRRLIKDVFDFEYVWEVYKPVAQRKFGYYVLPVLRGDTFIGRVEPEHVKDSRELNIKNWWWEDGIEVTEELVKSVMEAFESFSNYLGVSYNEKKIRKLL